MQIEIQKATEFLTEFVSVPYQQTFKKVLAECLSQKYILHWNPSYPLCGSGLRAINIVNGFADSILLKACQDSHIPNSDLAFPLDLVIWVDPNHVSYRIGDFGFPIPLWEESKKVTISHPSTKTPANFRMPSNRGNSGNSISIRAPAQDQEMSQIAVA